MEVRGQGDEQEQVTMWRGLLFQEPAVGHSGPQTLPQLCTHTREHTTDTHTQSPERVPTAEEPGKNGQGDLSARGSSEGVGWHRDV